MSTRQKAGAIIVAAGESKRMGGIDKMWALIDGKPVLARTIEVFANCNAIDHIVIVLNKMNLKKGRLLKKELAAAKKITLCTGGKRRQDSVAAGLAKLSECQWVVIHDGARPLVTTDLIERCLEAARETGTAIAAVPITDTVKIVRNNKVKQTVPRHVLWAAQTPQVFRYDIITEAHSKVSSDATDDASLVEQIKYKVVISPGATDNIKITTPDDLILAESILKKNGQ
ncbi:MAG: 2-C-methyl-D-erythritol 4-phosphate cytidylyltransferase [Dehalococcoidales bacterium]|nr:2-C-methyl-D-erythritol 4-phosphate cytidylyltransferase [Dehalococcoidales bacterium]